MLDAEVFIRGLIDQMQVVSNAQSIAAMRLLSGLLGRRVGPSTGTNFVAMLELAAQMKARGEKGSLLSLICDAGERYLPTYHNAAWVSECMGDCEAAQAGLERMLS
ncbi:MAG: hypothetical protein HC858_09655 [Brachymonas sp.]|nr:hypothetical protein [Brachymonas sp.]